MLSKWKLFAVLATILLVIAVMPAYAQQISVSGVLHGFDNPSDEYPIYVEAGEQIGIMEVCVGGGLDPEVNVYGPNGFFRNDDDGGSVDCAQAQSSRLQFRAPVTGIYVIVASSYEIISDNDPGDPNANGVYTLLIDGDFEPRFAYNADGRVNFGYGDLYAVIYTVEDDAGNPAIDIYCFDGAEWSLALRVTEDTGNTSVTGCSVDIYVLEDGSYQFNINYDGKLYSLICADLTCQVRTLSYFDPNE